MDHISTLVDGLEEFDALANEICGVFSSEWIDPELFALLTHAISANHYGEIRCLLIENRNSCVRSDNELLTDFNGAFTLISRNGISTFLKEGDDFELLIDLDWLDLNGVFNLGAFADSKGNTVIYFADSENKKYIWGGSFYLGECDVSLYIQHLNDAKKALSELVSEKKLVNFTKDATLITPNLSLDG
jgi:hypothetical protein